MSSALARRLAVTRQRLSGVRPPADAAGMLDVIRDLRCLQLDPISAVARSHLLVLWSRLGPFDTTHLDVLLWQERKLFEDWAHAASIVLTEDYPIIRVLKRRHLTGDSLWVRRFRVWLKQNDVLRRHVLSEVRRRGPLLSRQIEDKATSDWSSTGWNAGRNVDRMLAHLWHAGTIMVAGRSGGQKLWDLTERCLPPWTPRERLSDREVTRRAAHPALRALGVARPCDIEQHFIRGQYAGFAKVLTDLHAEGRIVRVQIGDRGDAWPGAWYVHVDDLPLLDRLAGGGWQPRTTLLSPFDNLICDRARTQVLFGFDYRIEIYVPPAQRRHGYYVMPILHKDRLIGRVDQKMDRSKGRLDVHAVYAEPDAPRSPDTARAVAGAIEDLAAFLGAREIAYGRRLPPAWRRALR